MGKVNDAHRSVAIKRRKRMQRKMRGLRAQYNEASSESAKDAILKKALHVNRFMTRHDFLGIAPEKKAKEVRTDKGEKGGHKHHEKK